MVSSEHDFELADVFGLVTDSLRTRPPDTTPELIVRASAKRRALRHQALTANVARIDRQLDQLASRQNPALMAGTGIGPSVAEHLLANASDNQHASLPRPSSPPSATSHSDRHPAAFQSLARR
ncbi:hypothetical protein [Cryobacterium sp. PH31-L1]|uniref:hypothetical protein n=1 Tax=Cryobacterium sp. PH31-L1 TaxID=3046199 RepID=UPI0024B87897|nr:hypothetical protein [Cryobacterium sp. PH31-L1]MDJ0379072.1 hypothetical protein [Cryobacterium sp. PH31-L1]